MRNIGYIECYGLYRGRIHVTHACNVYSVEALDPVRLMLDLIQECNTDSGVYISATIEHAYTHIAQTPYMRIPLCNVETMW